MHTEPRCRTQNPSLESIPKQGRDFFRSFVTSVIVKSIFVRIECLLYEKMESACSMLNYFCWSMLNFVICKTSRLFVSIIFITDQYWYYGEACSSRTNVYHRSYTSREPFSPLFRVCHVNVGWRYFNFFASVNNLFGSKNNKWQRTGTVTN